MVEELNAKTKENEMLKNRITQFRQQLKFQVSRLRQFQSMPPQPTRGRSEDVDEPDLLLQKDLEIEELRKQIEDRDKFISEQVCCCLLAYDCSDLVCCRKVKLRNLNHVGRV